MMKIKKIILVTICFFVFSCKNENDADLKKIESTEIEILENEDNPNALVEEPTKEATKIEGIDSKSKFFELVISQTMIREFSISNGDLKSSIEVLKNELHGEYDYGEEQRRLKFSLMNNFEAKTDIRLKNVNMKVLLELLCHQYQCEYRVKDNTIIFYANTDIIDQ